ncbi:glutamate-tRNA ligase [Glomus cerebriforme]|uniref:Probable glutamate--tRNA ligase, cytoplasmic n=1 Tax=Glomus cerebriforme TaxID=658196 RepID=A0A397T2N1_9GLOM|nr:glutamate-tRNA ligase [Glomus cerebriforme]
MTTTIHVCKRGTNVPYGIIALVHYINSQLDSSEQKINIQWHEKINDVDSFVVLEIDDNEIIGSNVNIARYIAKKHKCLSLGNNSVFETTIDHWIDKLETNDFKTLEVVFDEINHHLTLRTFLVDYKLSFADFIIWGALKNSAVFNRQIKTGKEVGGPHLIRWVNYINSLDFVQQGINWVTNAIKPTKSSSKVGRDQPNMNIGLIDAQVGKVVTRFPPEPSGYLHIGHAKAAMLNHYFAQEYKGKLIVRFDDTNPTKEKEEFEESIKEDLALLEIYPDQVTYTSDSFDILYQYAIKIIEKGLAYVDDTDVSTMRKQRMDGIPSKSRDLSVQENLARFKEMTEGSEFGLKCCLRAKIDMSNPNKALRDPVIYRCNLDSHHRTGNKWKVYPTYDFACPIVDSIEGVTHALRTIEYRDRNPQYDWFLKSLELRKVHVWDFSRMNFVYTLLSKRKLQWFVNQGLVSGWDDPRFPTIRGIRRRGMTVEALKQYILTQGASQNDVTLEWDKLWALNKKVIDPIAPRHTSIIKQYIVKTSILGGPDNSYSKEIAKHKKNPDVGKKQTWFSSSIWIEQDDAKTFEKDEEITLMDWGNAIVKTIHKSETNPDIVTGLELLLNLEGDFKKTKKKITWIADTTNVSEVVLVDYDYLITKRKLEEDDDVEEFITEKSEFLDDALTDHNVKELKKGEIIQFERRGYYILDNDTSESALRFIRIPDGKASNMASKAGENPGKKKETKKEEITTNTTGIAFPVINEDITNNINMYKVPDIYGIVPLPKPEQVLKMYKIQNIYV